MAYPRAPTIVKFIQPSNLHLFAERHAEARLCNSCPPLIGQQARRCCDWHLSCSAERRPGALHSRIFCSPQQLGIWPWTTTSVLITCGASFGAMRRSFFLWVYKYFSWHKEGGLLRMHLKEYNLVERLTPRSALYMDRGQQQSIPHCWR